MYNLVSIVLPVYNQSDHVRDIVLQYLAPLDALGFPYELILAVNGCRDSSLQICEELAATHPHVRVMHSEQGGWGLGVKLGLHAAQGDLLCYTNSARTSPSDLTLMICYGLANPGKIIKANRKIRDGITRRLGSLLYNLECRMLFDLSVWDINGTPKIFPRSCDKLLALTCNDDMIDAEFNAVCRKENYPVLEVPIFSARRHGGTSTTRLSSAFRMYIGALRLKKRLSELSS